MTSSYQPQANQIRVQSETELKEFDVFLCYNAKDKSAVKKIGEQLKQRGILPWLDEWELRPGLPWQRSLEQQIGQIKSAAVFVGESGIGPWQQLEVEAYLRQFVKRGCPVIPVLLSYAHAEPQLPVFIEGMTWVDFRLHDPDPMEQLIWGIVGVRPGSNETPINAPARLKTPEQANIPLPASLPSPQAPQTKYASDTDTTSQEVHVDKHTSDPKRATTLQPLVSPLKETSTTDSTPEPSLSSPVRRQLILAGQFSLNVILPVILCIIAGFFLESMLHFNNFFLLSGVVIGLIVGIGGARRFISHYLRDYK